MAGRRRVADQDKGDDRPARRRDSLGSGNDRTTSLRPEVDLRSAVGGALAAARGPAPVGGTARRASATAPAGRGAPRPPGTPTNKASDAEGLAGSVEDARLPPPSDARRRQARIPEVVLRTMPGRAAFAQVRPLKGGRSRFRRSPRPRSSPAPKARRAAARPARPTTGTPPVGRPGTRRRPAGSAGLTTGTRTSGPAGTRLTCGPGPAR